MDKKIKHVVWDWDGTLFDNVWLCHEIIQGQLKAHGLRAITLDQYRDRFHFPLESFYRDLGFDLDAEPYGHLAEEFITSYNGRRHEVSLRAKTREVLQMIKSSGRTQSIVSAYPQEYLQSAVIEREIDGCFDSVNGISTTLADSKISLAKKWISSVQHDPEEILMVGDTTHDFEVAETIGIRCILLETGHQSRRQVLATGAPVIRTMEEVLEFLDG